MENTTRITTNCCSACHRHGPGVSTHVENVPHAKFICGGCDPEAFEKQARNDINEWLEGGDFLGSRVR